MARHWSGVSSGAPSCQLVLTTLRKFSRRLLNKYQLGEMEGEATEAAASKSEFMTVHMVASPPYLRPRIPTLVRSISHRADSRSTKPSTARRTWPRSEEHTSELKSLMRISYAVFCLKTKTNHYIKY